MTERDQSEEKTSANLKTPNRGFNFIWKILEQIEVQGASFSVRQGRSTISGIPKSLRRQRRCLATKLFGGRAPKKKNFSRSLNKIPIKASWRPRKNVAQWNYRILGSLCLTRSQNRRLAQQVRRKNSSLRRNEVEEVITSLVKKCWQHRPIRRDGKRQQKQNEWLVFVCRHGQAVLKEEGANFTLCYHDLCRCHADHFFCLPKTHFL